MNPNQEILVKKFRIKKTRKFKNKTIRKSDSQIKKEMYNRMRVQNSMGPRPAKKVCNAYLSEQIKSNLKSGKWHYKQAIAIAYKQVQSKQTGCKKYYKS